MNANGAAVEHGYGRPVLSSLHGLWSVGGFVAAGTTALVTALGVPAELHLVVAAIVFGLLGLAACTRLMPAAERPGDRPASWARPKQRRGWRGWVEDEAALHGSAHLHAFSSARQEFASVGSHRS